MQSKSSPLRIKQKQVYVSFRSTSFDCSRPVSNLDPFPIQPESHIRGRRPRLYSPRVSASIPITNSPGFIQSTHYKKEVLRPQPLSFLRTRTSKHFLINSNQLIIISLVNPNSLLRPFSLFLANGKP